MAAACSVALLLILASRLSGDAQWRGWPRYTRGAAGATVACVIVYGIWSTQPSGYAGSFERAAIIIPTLWGASFLHRLGRGVPFMRERVSRGRPSGPPGEW